MCYEIIFQVWKYIDKNVTSFLYIFQCQENYLLNVSWIFSNY